LAPVFEKIFEKYQSNSEDNCMWFEPAIAPNFDGIGFEKPPGGEIGSSKHLLNEHSYCCGANLDF
jgi:hypothetical protein